MTQAVATEAKRRYYLQLLITCVVKLTPEQVAVVLDLLGNLEPSLNFTGWENGNGTPISAKFEAVKALLPSACGQRTVSADDIYYEIAREYFGYMRGATLAKDDREVLELAVRLRNENSVLRSLVEDRARLDKLDAFYSAQSPQAWAQLISASQQTRFRDLVDESV